MLPRRRSPDGGLRIVLSHVYAWPEVRRGGERYLHELAAALAGGGHPVTILTSAPTGCRRAEMGVPVVAVRRREFRPPGQQCLAIMGRDDEGDVDLGPRLAVGHARKLPRPIRDPATPMGRPRYRQGGDRRSGPS